MQLIFSQCATLVYTKAYKLAAAALISPLQAYYSSFPQMSDQGV